MIEFAMKTNKKLYPEKEWNMKKQWYALFLIPLEKVMRGLGIQTKDTIR